MTVPLALCLGAGAAAAAIVAAAARAYAVHGVSARGHRCFAALAGILCASGLVLLVAGGEIAGGIALGLAATAFFCSVLFVGQSPPDDGDDGRGGEDGDDGDGGDDGGTDGPAGDPAGGPGLEWDWERFERDLREHTRERTPSPR